METANSPDAGSPSAARVESNRTNAQRSTGPKTAEGKARSSRNATKHGIYVRTGLAVQHGPFAEDTVDVESFLDEVMTALAPRDILEVGRVTRIAQLQLAERRLDTWEASLLEAEEIALALDEGRQNDRILDVALTGICEWNMRRDNDDASAMESETEGEPPWMLMAHTVRPRDGEGEFVLGVWDPGNVPSDAAQWKSAFETLATNRFPTTADLRAWLRETNERTHANSLTREAQHRRTTAESALQATDRCTALRSRLTNELGRQFAILALLQQRQLD